MDYEEPVHLAWRHQIPTIPEEYFATNRLIPKGGLSTTNDHKKSVLSDAQNTKAEEYTAIKFSNQRADKGGFEQGMESGQMDAGSRKTPQDNNTGGEIDSISDPESNSNDGSTMDNVSLKPDGNDSEGEGDEFSEISDNSDYFIDNITIEPNV